MSKCDFCRDEITAGGIPVCVTACPTRALTMGELGEMHGNPEKGQTFAPLPDYSYTEPAAVFEPHRLSKPVGSNAGRIANPEEC